ncbi:MAG: hypothetical protein HZB39_11045 [Planctomycetes bacterium]|nr:hypothetical protein [Planctomycetota bacterium]
MSSRPSREFVSSLVFAALAASLSSQSSPPPIDPALRARFGFVGPSVVKIGDGIEFLRVVDLDGDRRAEICICDPARAHIETLRVADDGAITRTSLDTRGTSRSWSDRRAATTHCAPAISTATATTSSRS